MTVHLRRTVIASLCVAALAASCRPGEPAPPRPAPPTPGVRGEEPVVRVGVLVDRTDVTVGAPDSFAFHAPDGRVLAEGRGGETWTVAARGVMIEGRSSSGRGFVSSTGPVRVMAAGGTISIGEGEYRGEALLLARGNDRITAVNTLALEAYLRGVVPREIGSLPASDIEAVKAQAVAARTYAIGNLGVRRPLGFDFHATVQDQVYGGLAVEDEVASRAVDETRGVIATYDGEPILAYYSSTCGGRTANIEDAWPWRTSLPYLRSVSDADGTGGYYCDFSNRFRWSADWSRANLLEVLGQTIAAHLGGPRDVRSVTRVAITERSPSGTVSAELEADGRVYRLRADSLRWVLRPAPGTAILNSARLTELEAHRGGSDVDSLHIEGNGWGHAVGMCQVGAIGRARAGQSYGEILRAYYTGIELTTLY